jgi:hypothetical protein
MPVFASIPLTVSVLGNCSVGCNALNAVVTFCLAGRGVAFPVSFLVWFATVDFDVLTPACLDEDVTPVMFTL